MAFLILMIFSAASFFAVFLVGAFRRKTQTIVVTFFKDQRSDRFHKLYKLRPLTATLVTSTAT